MNSDEESRFREVFLDLNLLLVMEKEVFQTLVPGIWPK